MDIATILTCFNRKEKTTHCLSNLFAAEEYYNSRCVETDKINIVVFLTNDGCTDGTPEAVQDVCVGHELHIINGDGNCYWAGGMRMAWNDALKHKNDWDFYLLLNDDTFMENDCFISLLKTHKYSINTYGKPGIYSGITCDTHAKDKSHTEVMCGQTIFLVAIVYYYPQELRKMRQGKLQHHACK